MSQPVEATTTALMRLALDGAALRHQAIAANIANVATPGYAAANVSFQGSLQEARERMLGGESIDAVAKDAAPQIEVDEKDQPVALDVQTAQLAENVVHYQALLRGWSKRMSILAAAISEGKR